MKQTVDANVDMYISSIVCMRMLAVDEFAYLLVLLYRAMRRPQQAE